MFGKFFTKIFGSRNSRLIKAMGKDVQRINALEDGLAALSDADLQAKTSELKERLSKGETVDDLLAEAFAVVREASKRVLEMRHFDVQLMGGMVLHQGKISEMRTGEGKTLVATLPAYLNALAGKGVHIVTVNDYLATRDSEWMGKIFRFLGLTVGVVLTDQETEEKQNAYQADITYGTNNEFGFDYLRDNMRFHAEEKLQQNLHFAIIDEVDSILIDEARTPLIISGPAEDSTDLYTKINAIVPSLSRQERQEGEKEGEETGPGDYSIDEKTKQATLTEAGHVHVEQLLIDAGLLDQESSLYDASNLALLHHLNAALRAHALYQREVDYIVKDGEVVIIDEFTGRMMPGRRWSEGLHQAIEAKEGANIQNESQTFASITFQNYFRLYDKLSGMTGTADTEASEFQQIYTLEVLVVPTHRDMVRIDNADKIYRTPNEKHMAIIEDIVDCHKRKQPALVGTISIESSELLSQILKQHNVPHNVLNAKHHGSEAQIVAEAGRPGAVTIATNMAGRGTDIVLGGNLEVELADGKQDEGNQQHIREDWQLRHKQVVDAGGLHVIGTERHESRRIDNQLRGRSGRQGDPGSSRFYLSLDDNLMRIFGSERIAGLMEKLGMEEGEAIEHPWVSKAIENAQRKVEGHNFDIRKQLLEYDDVANEQRKIIYSERDRLMNVENISENMASIRNEVITDLVGYSVPPGSLEEQWDLKGLQENMDREFGLQIDVEGWMRDEEMLDEHRLIEKINEAYTAMYQQKVGAYGSEVMQEAEKSIMLQILDREWKDHLAAMDHLRQGIGLRGYAQKNPKEEYKREAFTLFSDMLRTIKAEVIRVLARVEIHSDEDLAALEMEGQDMQDMQFLHPDLEEGQADESDVAVAQQPVVRKERKVGRNEPCPCGSGKKYKHCHGKLT